MEPCSKSLSDDKLVVFYANDHIAFISNKVDAEYHRHNYIQITLGLANSFMVHIEEKVFITKGIVVAPNVSHSLQGNSELQLYLLINPESNLGEIVKKNLLGNTKVHIIEDKDINKVIGNEVYQIETITSKKYNAIIRKLKEDLRGSTIEIDKKIDSRILNLITYIESHPLDELTIKALSNIVFLSESRLSHLFKKEMGISITSYILHEKLKKAFKLIFNGVSITEAAIEAGFNSSSHFTSSSQDKLGMAPRLIAKDSRYLKV